MIKTITYNGQPLKVEIMRYEGQEQWSEFELNDGSRVRVRLCVREMLKAVDAFTEDGNPLYIILTDRMYVLEIPDNLKKPPQIVMEGNESVN